MILDDTHSVLENFTYNKSIDYGIYGLDDDQKYSLQDFYDSVGGIAPERNIAKQILMFVSPFLLALGTAGNIISMFVLLKLTAKVLSSCYYIAVLTILDLVILYIRNGNLWVHAVSGLDISNLLIYCSEAACKVYPFAFNCVFHMSRWLVVCVAIEGFIGTKMPEKVMKLCNHERAKGIMWLITVLLIWVNIHYFWSFERLPLKEGKMTVGYTCNFAAWLSSEGRVHQHSEEFQKIIWPILELLIGELIPLIVIMVCAVTMIVRLKNGKHKGDRHHQSWRHKYMLNPGAHDDTYKMIMALCYTYLVFTVPKSAFTIFKYFGETGKITSFKYDHIDVGSKIVLAQGLFSIADGCFCSLKFFVYYASSETFRKEAAYLLRCFWCKHGKTRPIQNKKEHCNNDVVVQDREDAHTEELLTDVKCTTI